MEWLSCPRVKVFERSAGECILTELRVYTVGMCGMFFSTAKHLIPIPVMAVPREEANVVLSVASVYSAQSEYCRLRVLPDRMEIQCRDEAGVRNAAALLAQAIQRREDGGFALPCGRIEDWPDASYRAMMLESSGRVWMPMEELRAHIREMALCRMNVLQFHFMEYNGCTVPLKSALGLHGFGENNLRFTVEEVRNMIVYAGEMGIAVTPFVEILSHAADLAQSEGIACPGDTPEAMFDVCVGQEKTYAVIERVLAEIAEIFPNEVLHIGADEYDMSAVLPLTAYWDRCPHCQKLSKERGYTTLRELFLYAIERINGIVNGLGRVMMLWNADLQPGHLPEGLSRNMAVHYYRHCSDLGKEKTYNLHINGYIEDGFSVINSYYPETYMDSWGYMSTEKLNGWTHHGIPAVKRDNRAAVPGGCCCAWETHEHYLRTIPAAIPLFADRLWNATCDPVAYDGDYGRAVTRVLFGTRLSADTDVFAGIGDVLPPLIDGVPAHADRITASPEEMSTLRDQLRALAAEGDRVAERYADAVGWAMEKCVELRKNTAPVTTPRPFEG